MDHIFSILIITTASRKIMQPAVLSQCSKHGRNRKMKVPINVDLLGLRVSPLELQDEGFAQFTKKSAVHFLDEARWLGKTSCY